MDLGRIESNDKVGVAEQFSDASRLHSIAAGV
jgi:hypothetical protein